MKKTRMRKKRRQGPRNNNYLMKILTIVAIMVVAIGLGFCSAKYIVGPLVGYDVGQLKIKIPEKISGILDKDSEEDDSQKEADDQKDSSSQKDVGSSNEVEESDAKTPTKTGDDSGYALQFGCFSTESRAKELVKALKDMGISTTIVKNDDIYKVRGKLFGSKQKALAALNNIDGKEDLDVFIAKY